MGSEKDITSNRLSNKQGMDISGKLSHEDIDKIEAYRQTRKTSVLTILFTDIVGYTEFTYEAGEKVSAKFRHIHDEIIISQIKKDGHGEIIKQIGDSFLIVFSDPTIAVKQALKLQELFRVNAENLTHKDYQLKIRIGLHMGQVSVEDHIVPDVFGTHVNLASRVMSLAKGGQVIVSGSVWENASGWLKEEEDKDVESVFYGKIKLKGIGKPTDIYEFYTDETGKIGIPKPILKRKQKSKLLWIAVFVLFVASIIIIAPYFYKNNFGDLIENSTSNRDTIFLVDIRSSHADIEFLLNHEGVYSFNHPSNIIEPLEPPIINTINDYYLTLIKTNFISDYDFITEDQLKSEYLKKGQTVGQNIFDDDNLITRFFLGVIPHVYEIIENEKYLLHIELIGNILGAETMTLSTIDSAAYFLNEIVHKKIISIKKGRYASGTIIEVNGNSLVIGFIKKKYGFEFQVPSPGVSLCAFREYERPLGVKGGTNIQRLDELEKAIIYYGSTNEWIKKIDTANYNFSYLEYLDLMNDVWKAPSCTFSMDLGIDIKIIEVSDSIALAKIVYRKYPWMEPLEGDRVKLK